jgi:hypothetical protein
MLHVMLHVKYLKIKMHKKHVQSRPYSLSIHKTSFNSHLSNFLVSVTVCKVYDLSCSNKNISTFYKDLV